MGAAKTAVKAKKETTNGEAVIAARETPGFLGQHPGWALAIFLAGSLLFILLAYNLQTNGPLMQWDKPVSQALHRHAVQNQEHLLPLMRFFTWAGKEMLVALAAVFALYWLAKRCWRELIMLPAGAWVGGGAFVVLSKTYERARPVFPDPLQAVIPGPGFPSGHILSAVLFYGLLAYLFIPWLPTRFARAAAWVLTALLLLVMGFSRVYLGDHYPTDVVAGMAVGAAWGALIYAVIDMIYARVRGVSLKRQRA